MLTVPDWEADVPTTTLNFGKKAKIKKAKDATPNNDVLKKNIKKLPPMRHINLKSKGSVLSNKKNKQRLRQNLFKSKLANKVKNNNIQHNEFNEQFKTVKSNKNNEFSNKVTINSSSKQTSQNQKSKKRKITSSQNDEGKTVLHKKVKKSNSTKDVVGVSVNKRNKEADDTSKDGGVDLFFTERKTEGKNTIKKEKIAPKPVINSKKEKIRQMLQQSSIKKSVKASSGQNLRVRMLDRLKAAQFRYLNEKLYTCDGSEAKELFSNDPSAFSTYHEGYQQQLQKWPVNPLDVIVGKILKMPKHFAIVDMGCGVGALSARVPQPCRSFDLVSVAAHVEACDMARTPETAGARDVAVYCLALMGTGVTEYLLEANRVLKMGGTLLIAEVESRFDDVDAFTKDVQRLGFKLTKLDKTHQVFFFMEFKKVNAPPAKRSKLPVITLKPCLYKRR